MPASDPFEILRDAVRHSPSNIPLRQHLAEQLLERGRAAEAEVEFRAALQLDPEQVPLNVGLARAFYQQGKDSEAFVVVEQLLRRHDVPGQVHLVHARLLLRSGDVQRAVTAYRTAVREDPELADAGLAEVLGIEEGDGEDDASEVVEGRVRASWEAGGNSLEVEAERPRISFADVGGMEPLKEEIRLKIIYPLQQRELYEAYGKKIGGGILFYGPPGCGKTHLARATAGEISATFLAVGINDILDMWIGISERNLHDVFERARRHAPCVLFFDEVDALGARRSDMQGHGRQLINQFLSEMDGVKSSNEGVLILAATNAPWHLDPAFRRPGRFDRVLFVPPPDLEAREEILRLLCAGKPVEDLDHREIAKRCDQFSGADLKAVIDQSIEAKLKEAMKAGGLRMLTTKDILRVLKQCRPTTAEWFATARNHALYANQGGIYDDIVKYLKL